MQRVIRLLCRLRDKVIVSPLDQDAHHFGHKPHLYIDSFELFVQETSLELKIQFDKNTTAVKRSLYF